MVLGSFLHTFSSWRHSRLCFFGGLIHCLHIGIVLKSITNNREDFKKKPRKARNLTTNNYIFCLTAERPCCEISNIQLWEKVSAALLYSTWSKIAKHFKFFSWAVNQVWQALSMICHTLCEKHFWMVRWSMLRLNPCKMEWLLVGNWQRWMICGQS